MKGLPLPIPLDCAISKRTSGEFSHKTIILIPFLEKSTKPSTKRWSTKWTKPSYADDDGDGDAASTTAFITGAGIQERMLMIVGTADGDEVFVSATSAHRPASERVGLRCTYLHRRD